MPTPSATLRRPSFLVRQFGVARSTLAQYENQSPEAFAVVEQTVGGLLIADGVFGTVNPFQAGRKQGLLGSVYTIGFAIVWLLITTVFIGGLAHPGAYTGHTTGTVTNIDRSTSRDSNGHYSTTCADTVRYTVDGREFNATESVSSSCGGAIGDVVEITYNPNQPSDFLLASHQQQLSLFLNLFALVGWFLLVTGVVTLAIRVVTIILGWRILRRGRALAAAHPAPPGENWENLKSQVREFFQQTLWGFTGAGTVAGLAGFNGFNGGQQQTPSFPQAAPTPLVTSVPPPSNSPDYTQNYVPQQVFPVAADTAGFSGLAIASLIASIVNFGLGAILGIVMGHIALANVKRTGQRGAALAVAGLIFGYLGLVLDIIIVIVLILSAQPGGFSIGTPR